MASSKYHPSTPQPSLDMSLVNVHTKERGRAPADLPRTIRFRDIATLDVVATPAIPLGVGTRIRIHILRRKKNPDGGLSEAYRSVPSDIVGSITSIRTMELAFTEFIIQNENVRSTTITAYLAVPHIPGVTVSLSVWQASIRTLLLPFLPHTRHILFDEDIIEGVESPEDCADDFSDAEEETDADSTVSEDGMDEN